MPRPLLVIGGFWELWLIAWRSRFNLRNAYWRWRDETAFGTDPAQRPPLTKRCRQIVAYGIWVHQMKRGS